MYLDKRNSISDQQLMSEIAVEMNKFFMACDEVLKDMPPDYKPSVGIESLISDPEAKGYPVFIVLMHTGKTPLSKAVVKVKHSEFSHASISLVPSLDPMYTMGARIGDDTKEEGGCGYDITHPKIDYYRKYKTKYAVYYMEVDKRAHERMEARLSYLSQNWKRIKYDWLGLARMAIHKTTMQIDKFVCSSLVSHIIEYGVGTSQDASLYAPEDLKNVNENVVLVAKGDDLYYYNEKETIKTIRMIRETTGIKVVRSKRELMPTPASLAVESYKESIKWKDYFKVNPNAFEIVTEATSHPDHKNPIYIVLIDSSSPMSYIQHATYDAEWTHAAISFTDTLDPMYTMELKSYKDDGPKIGFSIVPHNNPYYRKQKAKYGIYYLEVDDAAYAKMKNRLDYLIKNKNRWRYNVLGVLQTWFRTTHLEMDKFLCSTLVAFILEAGIDLKMNSANFMPQDLAMVTKDIVCVDRGDDLFLYTPDNVRKNIIQLKEGKFVDLDLAQNTKSARLRKLTTDNKNPFSLRGALVPLARETPVAESVFAGYVEDLAELDDSIAIERLTMRERKMLPDNVFGLPEDRKYPLDTPKRVKDAIGFFHFCAEEKRDTLAHNIVRAVIRLNLKDTISFSPTSLIVKHMSESDKARINIRDRTNSGSNTDDKTVNRSNLNKETPDSNGSINGQKRDTSNSPDANTQNRTATNNNPPRENQNGNTSNQHNAPNNTNTNGQPADGNPNNNISNPGNQNNQNSQNQNKPANESTGGLFGVLDYINEMRAATENTVGPDTYSEDQLIEIKEAATDVIRDWFKNKGRNPAFVKSSYNDGNHMTIVEFKQSMISDKEYDSIKKAVEVLLKKMGYEEISVYIGPSRVSAVDNPLGVSTVLELEFANKDLGLESFMSEYINNRKEKNN